MKIKNKVLVIPGGFVPYNDTVTLISYKHLRNLNAEFDVIALKGDVDPGLAENLKHDPNYNKFNVQYICDYDQAIATIEKKNVISGIYYLLKYCYYAKKQAMECDYDVVYTSSIPAFTHLAGYWIKKKKKNKIKWIASLSDPLYKSPYKYDKDSFKDYNLLEKIGFFVYISIYMNGLYEKLCQKYADKVIYICDEQRKFTVQNYPNPKELYDKSLIIPLNYIKDWDIYINMLSHSVKIKSRQPIIFSHFGRIYGLRKIDKVLEVLKVLKKENPNLSDRIKFIQYGQIIPRYLKMIKEYKIEDCFVVHSKVTYNDCLQKMKESDGLILFDTILDEDLIQPYLPSKVLEYILMKKPLFILTNKNSPSYRIFSELGYKCTLNNFDNIKQSIKDIMDCDTDSINDYDISQFENKRAVKPLINYLDSNNIT